MLRPASPWNACPMRTRARVTPGSLAGAQAAQDAGPASAAGQRPARAVVAPPACAPVGRDDAGVLAGRNGVPGVSVRAASDSDSPACCSCEREVDAGARDGVQAVAAMLGLRRQVRHDLSAPESSATGRAPSRESTTCERSQRQAPRMTERHAMEAQRRTEAARQEWLARRGGGADAGA